MKSIKNIPDLDSLISEIDALEPQEPTFEPQEPTCPASNPGLTCGISLENSPQNPLYIYLQGRNGSYLPLMFSLESLKGWARRSPRNPRLPAGQEIKDIIALSFNYCDPQQVQKELDNHDSKRLPDLIKSLKYFHHDKTYTGEIKRILGAPRENKEAFIQKLKIELIFELLEYGVSIPLDVFQILSEKPEMMYKQRGKTNLVANIKDKETLSWFIQNHPYLFLTDSNSRRSDIAEVVNPILSNNISIKTSLRNRTIQALLEEEKFDAVKQLCKDSLRKTLKYLCADQSLSCDNKGMDLLVDYVYRNNPNNPNTEDLLTALIDELKGALPDRDIALTAEDIASKIRPENESQWEVSNCISRYLHTEINFIDDPQAIHLLLEKMHKQSIEMIALRSNDEPEEKLYAHVLEWSPLLRERNKSQCNERLNILGDENKSYVNQVAWYINVYAIGFKKLIDQGKIHTIPAELRQHFIDLCHLEQTLLIDMKTTSRDYHQVLDLHAATVELKKEDLFAARQKALLLFDPTNHKAFGSVDEYNNYIKQAQTQERIIHQTVDSVIYEGRQLTVRITEQAHKIYNGYLEEAKSQHKDDEKQSIIMSITSRLIRIHHDDPKAKTKNKWALEKRALEANANPIEALEQVILKFKSRLEDTDEQQNQLDTEVFFKGRIRAFSIALICTQGNTMLAMLHQLAREIATPFLDKTATFIPDIIEELALDMEVELDRAKLKMIEQFPQYVDDYKKARSKEAASEAATAASQAASQAANAARIAEQMAEQAAQQAPKIAAQQSAAAATINKAVRGLIGKCKTKRIKQAREAVINAMNEKVADEAKRQGIIFKSPPTTNPLWKPLPASAPRHNDPDDLNVTTNPLHSSDSSNAFVIPKLREGYTHGADGVTPGSYAQL